jgi:hypothetical protein
VLDSTKKLASVSFGVAKLTDLFGIGFKTPQTAIDSDFVDHKCPFTGNVSIRGRIFK